MRIIEIIRIVMARTCCMTSNVEKVIKNSELVQFTCMFRVFKCYVESITYSK